MSYEILDLVRERANERDWELIFDSGPNGDIRTMVWEHPCPDQTGQLMELEITFNTDGRVVRTEKRRGGKWCQRTTPATGFGSTEVCIETLGMI
ncbi:hypothetical protein [Mycolicibacterium sp. XJ870]